MSPAHSGRAAGAFLLLCCELLSSGCGSSGSDSNAAVYDAWVARRSGAEVTASGSVAKVLGTRSGPSGRHEGFLVHLRGAAGHGLTVRVEDNVDITGPIPLAPGDDVEVRGEYVYDEDGGLIHFTHHESHGSHPGGYVRVGDRVYL